MARIEPLSRDAVDPSLDLLIAAADERLPAFMNQILTLAHHPRIANDLVTMYLGFRDESYVDPRLIELAVLTVSQRNRCIYCVSHHTPLGLEAGLSDAALADLQNGRGVESPHFSNIERLVIAYAEQVTADARRVPAPLFQELRTHFDKRQLVELTVRIALANFFNRLNDALQIEIEPGVEQLLVE